MGRKKRTVVVEEELPEEKYEVKHRVTLKIDAQPYIEMREYAKRFTPTECSGMGLVERQNFTDGSVEFTVTEVFLPNQYNSGGATDIPDEEMNKLNTELVVAGKDTSKLKFHWHSHVNFGVFHSGTDDENYDELQSGDYLVSLVVNNAGDMLGSVHIYEPVRIDVCNIEVEAPAQWEIDELTDEKITVNHKRVKDAEPALKAKHTPVYSGGYYQGGYYQGGIVHKGNRTTWREGLAWDPDFEQLLRAGEREGIITLFQDDAATIYGYMNNRTGESYELISEMDTLMQGGMAV